MDRIVPTDLANFVFYEKKIVENIVELSIELNYEVPDMSPKILNTTHSFIESCVTPLLLSSKNAVLLGSVFVDYAEDMIGNSLWKQGKDYFEMKTSVWQGLHSLGGRQDVPMALFFPSVPTDFLNLELEQAFTNDSIAVFVNYLGPSDLDSIALSPMAEDNMHEDIVARILKFCQSAFLADSDGLGLRICTKVE